ncbi:MAG: hypothetical protein QM535_20695 [Limnohabitans sp.]|nr:hypothetical protein [Limnohabitans sp.]
MRLGPLKSNTLKDEEEQKKIPLRVFEYHLSAINTHLDNGANYFNLKSFDYFNNGIQKVSTYDEDKIKRLLYNSWSTEFALLTSSMNDDQDFKKFSLHWCFPQAYYSVFLSTTAYYYLKNINIGHNHKGLLNEFSQQVKRKWYPTAMSFHCSGNYGNYSYNNICDYESKNAMTYSKYDPQTADKQVAQFLKTTRDKLIEARKKDKQTSKTPFQTLNKKEAKKSLTKNEWKEISNRQWDTTIMDMLYRLRIKSNYEEVNSFIDADYDVSNIIEQLKKIVFKLNFVNECYIAKLISFEKLGELVNKFPIKTQDNYILCRFNEYIQKNK